MGGEERLALVEGHKQQIGLAGFVPEHALAVDPGGVIAQDSEGRFDLGAAVAAVDAQGSREQRPGQRVEAVIGGFGQQPQQLAQFLQEPCTWGQLVTGVDDGGTLLVEQRHGLTHQGQLLLPLAFGQGAQGCFNELTQVSARGWGASEGSRESKLSSVSGRDESARWVGSLRALS